MKVEEFQPMLQKATESARTINNRLYPNDFYNTETFLCYRKRCVTISFQDSSNACFLDVPYKALMDSKALEDFITKVELDRLTHGD